MSDIVPFFTSHTTQNGQKVSGALARQAKRQQEEFAIRTEHAAIQEQAHAFLTSQVMSNVSVLMLQARAHIQVDPGGAELYEGLIRSYGAGAMQRTSRF